MVGTLAFAALAVPTAQARIAIDSGIAPSAATVQTGVRPDDRAVRIVPQTGLQLVATRPDDRAVRIVPQGSPQLVATRPDDRAVRVTPQPSDLRDPGSVVETPVSFAPSGGSQFDWTDAGIGAGSALGLILVALGAMGTMRRLGHGSLAGT